MRLSTPFSAAVLLLAYATTVAAAPIPVAEPDFTTAIRTPVATGSPDGEGDEACQIWSWSLCFSW